MSYDFQDSIAPSEREAAFSTDNVLEKHSTQEDALSTNADRPIEPFQPIEKKLTDINDWLRNLRSKSDQSYPSGRKVEKEPTSGTSKEIVTEEVYIVRFKAGTDPEERNRLLAHLSRLGADFEPAARPPNVRAVPPDDVLRVPLLEDGRPALWAERTTGREVSPADFIRQHYGRTREDGTWDPIGLTRADLARLDPALYAAYGKLVERQPDRALPGLPPGQKRTRIDDPTKNLERRKQLARERQERYLQVRR